MVRTASVQPEDARPLDGRVGLGRAARRLRGELFPLGYHLAVLAILAASGTAPWRLAVVAAGMGLMQATGLARRHRAEARHCVNASWDCIAWQVSAAQLPVLVATAAAVAVTGGLRSPLVATLLAAYVGASAVVGDRLQTRLLLGGTALAVALLALAPRAATGAPPGGAAYAALAAASVIGVGALLAPIHAIIGRKREELVRQRSDIAAEALARAESLEQIGAKLAHELKNPLTGVKALVQLGARNPAEAPSRERLEVVEREVARMEEILKSYLCFTRPLLDASPRRVALGPLVADTLVVLSSRADEAGVRLFAQGDAAVEADPHRLREALLNLVANAIEASPPGGEVEVAVRPGADAVELVVRDSGHGMAPEVLARVGTPFFSTRERGTGLGVVLARAVVDQHGGALRFDSAPGRGTRVTMSLPRGGAGAFDARTPRG